MTSVLRQLAQRIPRVFPVQVISIYNDSTLPRLLSIKELIALKVITQQGSDLPRYLSPDLSLSLSLTRIRQRRYSALL